ncbi:copper chaperone PCu(A)C, partial [Nostoc sp. NIES-2111]
MMKHDILGVVTIRVVTRLATGTAPAANKGGPWKLGDIVVEQAWARLAPGGAGTGSVYLTVHNKSGQDDLLLAVDSNVAESTAVYSTEVKDGVVSMNPMPMGANLPSHGELVMRPGGIHIMVTGVSKNTTVGDLMPVKMV